MPETLLPSPLHPMRRKLPLMIAGLLTAVVVTFGWLASRELRGTLETVARERLAHSSQRLAGLLEQSAARFRAQATTIAHDPAVRAYLAAPAAARRDAAARALAGPALGEARPVSRALWSRACERLLSTGPEPVVNACPARERALAAAPGAASRGAWVSGFVTRGDTVVYATVAPVPGDRRDTVGYVVMTRVLDSKASMAALQGLIGAGALTLVGNATGPALWSDLARPVAGPAPAIPRDVMIEHVDADGVRQVGVATSLREAPWTVWVQMPRAGATAALRRILGDLALLALLCVIGGGVGAWLVARRVTAPLAQLTAAAESLAGGDYARRVPVRRRDELGQLMASFNLMAEQVETSAEQLTQQAHELELSNQELLEALGEAEVARRGQEQTEWLLEEVIRRAPVGIAVLDRDLRYARINPALAEMHGLPLEAHLGRRPGEIAPALRDAVEPILQHVLATGATLTNQKIGAQLEHSPSRHWLSSFFPVRGEHDEVTGVGVVVLDTTAHQELEAQLLQSQKMDAVGRLAGGVAHDFNNLLTVILSYSAMAQESVPATDALHEDLGEIHGAATRAAGLTKQLLAFSRKQMLQPQLLDLSRTARGMEQMLRRLIGEDVTLELDLAADTGLVSADPGQLEQVIMNLVVNARDAMPDGGRLVIGTANTSFSSEYSIADRGASASDFVTLTIADTGVGMSEATQAHLFEPFFTTKPPGQGTGLGLSTVYGIVRQSGGDVQVASALGRGTTFRVHLPRVHADGAADAAAAGPAPRRADARAIGTETILLVEDDDALRQLVRRILVDAGYTVLEASTPHDAIALGAAHPGLIDLLLTDVVMPGMSGRSVAERLAGHRRDFRVLYMSGYTDDDVMRRGITTAQHDFLSKPFTPERITRRVRQALDAKPAPPAG